jgi:hypothetical protein
MPGPYEYEVEPEVQLWLDSLDDRDFGRVDFLSACSLSSPRRSASNTLATLVGVRELRFRLLRQQTRDLLVGTRSPRHSPERVPQDPAGRTG